MSIWSRLFRNTGSRQVSNWAVEVARCCHAEVGSRLSDAIRRMSLPEARGYIRARAACVIDAELQVVQRRTGCTAAVIAAIRQQAVDETIRLAIGELLRSTRHGNRNDSRLLTVPLRKAA